MHKESKEIQERDGDSLRAAKQNFPGINADAARVLYGGSSFNKSPSRFLVGNALDAADSIIWLVLRAFGGKRWRLRYQMRRPDYLDKLITAGLDKSMERMERAAAANRQ